MGGWSGGREETLSGMCGSWVLQVPQIVAVAVFEAGLSDVCHVHQLCQSHRYIHPLCKCMCVCVKNSVIVFAPTLSQCHSAFHLFSTAFVGDKQQIKQVLKDPNGCRICEVEGNKASSCVTSAIISVLKASLRPIIV